MQNKYRVLILSANAKVPLIRAFQAAGAIVHAGDLSPRRAALVLSDHEIVLPKTASVEFAGALQNHCRRHQIDLIVPTRDGDLMALSELQAGLLDDGTRCLLSPKPALETCLDKRLFHDFCQTNDFPIARRYHPGMSGRLFVRPRIAAGGEGGEIVENAKEHSRFQDEMSLAQEYIDAPEYSVDLLSDFQGHPLQAVARRRVVVGAGEAQISEVEDQPVLVALAMKLGAAMKLVGHSVIQAFLHPGRGPLLIEVNARFGGASALSIEAGLNSPARILANLADPGAGLQNGAIRHGLTLLRYPNDLFLMPEDFPKSGVE